MAPVRSEAYVLEDEPLDETSDALRWLESPAPRSGRWQHSAPRNRRAADRLGSRYWRLWVATGISSIGDGLVTVALPLLALSQTRDALAVGGVLAALRLPWLFLAMPLGAIADRGDRRRMAVRTETLRAVILAVVAVAIAAGVHGLPFVYLIAVVLGSLETAFVAATSSAVPDLVATDQLARANGHLASANTAGEDFIGVGIGGALFVIAAAIPFLLDGVSFVFSAVLLLAALPRPVPPAATPTVADAVRGATPRPVTRIRSDVAEGLRYLSGDRALRLLLGANASLAFLQAMVTGVLVLLAVGPLHVARDRYGLFVAALAVGAVAGGALAGRVVRSLGNPVTLIAAATSAGLSYVLLAAAPDVAVAAVALAMQGFAVVGGRTAVVAMRQERVPMSLQARANTAFRAVIYGAVPAGALVGGLIADLSSLRTAVAVAGGLSLAFVALIGRPVFTLLTEEVVDVRTEETIDLRARLAAVLTLSDEPTG